MHAGTQGGSSTWLPGAGTVGWKQVTVGAGGAPERGLRGGSRGPERLPSRVLPGQRWVGVR